MKKIKVVMLFAVSVLFLAFSVSCKNNSSVNNTQEQDSIAVVQIGSQTWMVQNLDVDRFRNGDTIPEITDSVEWVNAGKEGLPAWCYYDNDMANGKIYGKLYNWHAVNDPRGLAPEGYHVPTIEEWTALADTLGEEVAGKMIKSTTGWVDDIGSTNETKFSAMPGGYRLGSNGDFENLGNYGRIWSSTEFSPCCASHPLINNIHDKLGKGASDKGDGFTVRCLADK